MIDALEKTPGIKAMLYVSDHGENLDDDDRKLFGHTMNTQYDLPVPMLLWVSKGLTAQYPDKVANAKANVSRRLTTRSVFYTLQDLASATLAGDDPAARAMSVFQKDCAEPKRLVSAESHPFDFDARFPAEQGGLAPGAVDGRWRAVRGR